MCRRGRVNLTDDGGVARIAGLKELGYSWQTTGDITSLTYGTRYLDKGVTSLYFCSIADYYVATDRQVVGAKHFALAVNDVAGGYEGTLLRFDDDYLAKSGCFVFFYTIGDAFLDVFKFCLTGHLSYDDGVEGIPLCDDGA